MHWCQDETNAMMAAIGGLPVIGYVCSKCREKYRAIVARFKRK